MLNNLRRSVRYWIRRKNFQRRVKPKQSCKDLQIMEFVKIECLDTKVGSNVQIRRNVQFLGFGKIRIGSDLLIGDNTIIYSAPGGGVEIGSNVLIAANCYIIDSDHEFKPGMTVWDQGIRVEPVRICDGVWLGTGVTVLRGVTIGEGAVVGAGSVVTKDIPANGIAVGSPAKVIRFRE